MRVTLRLDCQAQWAYYGICNSFSRTHGTPQPNMLPIGGDQIRRIQLTLLSVSASAQGFRFRLDETLEMIGNAGPADSTATLPYQASDSNMAQTAG